ncbi:MAG TPA: hypothetical protein VK902_23310 [Rubrobacter sp.]|nr:hypothetical protein [Rubrobacter sp.]
MPARRLREILDRAYQRASIVLILIVAAAVAVLLLLVMGLKTHAFVALVLVSFAAAGATDIPVGELTGTMNRRL